MSHLVECIVELPRGKYENTTVPARTYHAVYPQAQHNGIFFRNSRFCKVMETSVRKHEEATFLELIDIQINDTRRMKIILFQNLVPSTAKSSSSALLRPPTST